MYFDATALGEACWPFVGIIIFIILQLPFVYLMSYLFTSPAKAQLTTILSFIIFGIILGTVSFFLDLIPSTQDINATLKPLYRIFPVFLMTESFFNISAQQQQPDKIF